MRDTRNKDHVCWYIVNWCPLRPTPVMCFGRKRRCSERSWLRSYRLWMRKLLQLGDAGNQPLWRETWVLVCLLIWRMTLGPSLLCRPVRLSWLICKAVTMISDSKKCSENEWGLIFKVHCASKVHSVTEKTGCAAGFTSCKTKQLSAALNASSFQSGECQLSQAHRHT